jgi:hypothetical protein
MNRPGPFLKFVVLLLLLIGAVVGMCRVRWLFGPGGDGTLAELTSAAAGRDFKIVQKYNGNLAEPYTLGLYHRSNGGEWKWKYLDHESTRWGNARIIWNEARRCVDVYRNDDLFKEIPLTELDESAVPQG